MTGCIAPILVEVRITVGMLAQQLWTAACLAKVTDDVVGVECVDVVLHATDNIMVLSQLVRCMSFQCHSLLAVNVPLNLDSVVLYPTLHENAAEGRSCVCVP
jgi:hypothetical protein